MSQQSNCKVQITNADGAREFKELMKKHQLVISESSERGKTGKYTVESSENTVEEILMETSIVWKFI